MVDLLYHRLSGAKDANTRSALTARAKQYLDRAEMLKKQVEEAKQKPQGYHEQILIEDGAVGYGLETVFIPYIDSELTEVQIDDPYIRANHQVSSPTKKTTFYFLSVSTSIIFQCRYICFFGSAHFSSNTHGSSGLFG